MDSQRGGRFANPTKRLGNPHRNPPADGKLLPWISKRSQQIPNERFFSFAPLAGLAYGKDLVAPQGSIGLGSVLTLEDEDPIPVQLPEMSLEAADSAAFKASPAEGRHKPISQQNEGREKLNK